MKKKISLFILSLLFCVNVFAQSVQQIVFMGDSLSDNGNLYQLLFKAIPKSPPYYQGRFSNGPTWAEQVGKYYYDKYKIDSSNYAYGGASASLHSIFKNVPITLTTEVNTYLLHSLLTDKSQVLYVIWIGSNDYLFNEDQDANQLTDAVVKNIVTEITTLIKLGGQHFLIFNVPDLGKTPYGQQHHTADKLTYLAQLHNQKLANALGAIKIKNPTVKMASIDVFFLLNDLLQNTEKYNQLYGEHITNTTTACWAGGVTVANAAAQSLSLDLKPENAGKNVDMNVASQMILSSPGLAEAYAVGKAHDVGLVPCGDANAYVFWDGLHPTVAIHEIFAQMVIRTIESAGLR